MVAAEAPTPDQTDTEAKPKPVPNASRISEKAAVTKPPARTADHETPEELLRCYPRVGVVGSRLVDLRFLHSPLFSLQFSSA
jgi:hypothetical protein